MRPQLTLAQMRAQWRKKAMSGARAAIDIAFILMLGIPMAFGAADLGITNLASPDSVRVGGTLTYRIAVTNRGPDAATAVVVTDVLPDGMSFSSCAVSQGSYSNDSGTVYCNLGNIANRGTAAVTIVVLPAVVGIFTNGASISADNGSGGRAYAATTVNPANRSPEIVVEGSYVLSVGAYTSFVVAAQDPDHDPVVTVTNTMKPAGATFNGTNFTWTAPLALWNTTNVIEFVANDQQGEANSIVTNRAQIVVPYDGDVDSMDDGWEWGQFTTLTNAQIGDVDDDGQNNWTEYVAGTQPTNAASAFRVLRMDTTGSTHAVKVTTEPGRKYTIHFDDNLKADPGWTAFADTNLGVWVETNLSSTDHVFVDDEGSATSGAAPVDGRRYYRIKVERAP